MLLSTTLGFQIFISEAVTPARKGVSECRLIRQSWVNTSFDKHVNIEITVLGFEISTGIDGGDKLNANS